MDECFAFELIVSPGRVERRQRRRQRHVVAATASERASDKSTTTTETVFLMMTETLCRRTACRLQELCRVSVCVLRECTKRARNSNPKSVRNSYDDDDVVSKPAMHPTSLLRVLTNPRRVDGAHGVSNSPENCPAPAGAAPTETC